MRLSPLALLAFVLAACAPQELPQAMPSAICTPATMPTLAAGKLTIGTDEPAYPPWFVDNKPDNGQGFESAVAYAVAEKLGYAKDQVIWTRVTFNNAIAPGRKPFDIDINQFSITEERKNAVDFSEPYYDVAQTVITVKGSKIAGAKSLADLRAAKLGAQVGSTSFRAISEVIKPASQPAVFNNNDDAKQALQSGTVDGIVVDLPTAFYMTSAELDNGVIVGQVPQPAGAQPEQFGIVLDKGSPITPCVSKAVAGLRADGTLAKLQSAWLAGVSGATVLG
ncbi:ABC transporter substrate-binding protein [Allorhizocola rhizosphaerae]|uniref:ABC transporter substrate-binding protein n=1 Tax=Allorhizocola rhizosphaerae TaxID=1872709 RepID=UPI000E3C943A|nr:ABC transporter substrate-binding protein [Allorhizocola rhizosphaerae]